MNDSNKGQLGRDNSLDYELTQLSKSLNIIGKALSNAQQLSGTIKNNSDNYEAVCVDRLVGEAGNLIELAESYLKELNNRQKEEQV